MSNKAPIALILGAGANTGAAVSKAFSDNGYRIALAARSADPEKDSASELHIPVDLSIPTTVQRVLTLVKAVWGTPSVVIYTCASNTMDIASNPLGVSLDAFMEDLNINVNSVYAAIQEALKGFLELPSPASRTFILTGNAFNTSAFPPLLTLGVGKAASAHLIDYASKTYTMTGCKYGAALDD